MSFQDFHCGKYCAGKFYIDEHRQLRPDVTCKTCGKILHLLCGIGGQEGDTFDCKKCYDQKQKEGERRRKRERDKKHCENESEERKKVRREKDRICKANRRKNNQKKIKIRDEKSTN